MYRAEISYVEILVGGDKRIEKDCYQGEDLLKVIQRVYQAVLINRLEILEIHIYKGEEA